MKKSSYVTLTGDTLQTPYKGTKEKELQQKLVTKKSVICESFNWLAVSVLEVQPNDRQMGSWEDSGVSVKGVPFKL